MSFRDASMTAILDALSQTADKLFSNLGEPTDHALFQYSAALGGGSEEQVALQKSLRLLHNCTPFFLSVGVLGALPGVLIFAFAPPWPWRTAGAL